MLIRIKDGSLIEININDYLMDTDYYKEIMSLMIND
jgi:hypothetical protein